MAAERGTPRTSGFGYYRPGAVAPAPAVPAGAWAPTGAHAPAPNGAAGEPVGTDGAGPVLLADDAELDLSSDDARRDVEETLRRLDEELVGLANVKRRVREIAALLLVDRARSSSGWRPPGPRCT